MIEVGRMAHSIHVVVKGLCEELLQHSDQYVRCRTNDRCFSSSHRPSKPSSRQLVFGVMGGLEALGKWGEMDAVHIPLRCTSLQEKTYEAWTPPVSECLPTAEGKLELRLLILEQSLDDEVVSSENAFSSTEEQHPSIPNANYRPILEEKEATREQEPSRCFRRVAVECGSTFPRIAVLSEGIDICHSSRKSPSRENASDIVDASIAVGETSSAGGVYEALLDLNCIEPRSIRFVRIADSFPSLDTVSSPSCLPSRLSPLISLHFYSHDPRFPFRLYGESGESSTAALSGSSSSLRISTSSSAFEMYGLKKRKSLGASWQGVLPKPSSSKSSKGPCPSPVSSFSSPSFISSSIKDSFDDWWCVKDLKKSAAIQDEGLHPFATQDYWTATINAAYMENHVLELFIRVPLKKEGSNDDTEASCRSLGELQGHLHTTSSKEEAGKEDNNASSAFAYGSTVLAASVLSQGTHGTIDIPVQCIHKSEETEKEEIIWVVLHIQYTLHYPFQHAKNNFRLMRSDQSIQAVTSTKPVGHRGLGKTFTREKSSKIQFNRKLAENSIEAFIAAEQRGCEMVEFDVMLTQDGVPIVLHDPVVELLAMAEGTKSSHCAQNVVPISVPVHQLTEKQLQWVLKQSKHKENSKGTTLKDVLVRYWSDILTLAQSMVSKRTNQIEDIPTLSSKNGSDLTLQSFSASAALGEGEAGQPLSPPSAVFTPSCIDREGRGGKEYLCSLVKNRVDITHPVPKLKDLFLNTSTRLCFDIEVKYPFQPVHDENIFLQKDAFEINRFVDSILNVVMDYGGEERHIAFSSFEPEICVALAVKQSRFDVFFLSGSDDDLKDYRSYYVEGAIQFASAQFLSGISISSSFLQCSTDEKEDKNTAGKRIVNAAHRRGLKVWTWGEENSDAQFFQDQVNVMKVDAVITDNVTLR